MIRSVLTNFSARLGGAVLSFLMLLLTTRYLGKDVRGEIAAIQLAISIVQLVSDLAGSSSMVYLVPRTSLTKLLLAGSAWAVFSAATIGLSLVHFFDVIPANYNYATLLIALLIAYLPTIYSAFSRREVLVSQLTVRAGVPPTPAELFIRAHRVGYLDRLDDLFVLMRAGNGQHTRMRLANTILLDAEASRDDHPAIRIHGFADRVQAFLFR